MNYTPVRLHLFAAMLAKPDKEWTANTLAEAISATVDVPVSSVQDTFYLLMHERMVEAVPFQRALTVRLRTDARALLTRLVEHWRDENTEAASETAGQASDSEVAR